MSVNANIFNIQVKWKIYYSMNQLLSGTCNYRNFSWGKQVIDWRLGKETVKCHFSVVQRQIFQNFVQAIKSMNLQTHEPVYFKKTTKIEPHENKVFHSNLFFNFQGRV